MADYTKDEALAFVESMRLTVGGRTGFKWLGEKLNSLSNYIEATAAENERLNAYLDEINARREYEVYLTEHPELGT